MHMTSLVIMRNRWDSTYPQITGISVRHCFLSRWSTCLTVEILAARNKSTNTREIVERVRVEAAVASINRHMIVIVHLITPGRNQNFDEYREDHFVKVIRRDGNRLCKLCINKKIINRRRLAMTKWEYHDRDDKSLVDRARLCKH